jgi:tetratricopeptide (TPR) repeat protein
MRQWLVLLLLLALPLAAQDKRKEAFDLFEANQFVQALPLFEQLAEQAPEDGQIQLRLGFCRLIHANALTDRYERIALRASAREALEKAEKLGIQDSLLSAALASLEHDQGIKFSDYPRADEVMQRAEAAFAARDYPGARKLYQEALEHDPALYEAALFLGQCYRFEGDSTSAETWYQKAVDMNPHREAAYRYWGDALLSSGKPEPALSKFIEAYLRQPYGRLSRNGLIDYAVDRGLHLAHPEVSIPARVEGNNIEIAPDVNPAWLVYALSHTLWRDGMWALAHPGEAYRHSLEEEADCIRKALKSAEEGKTPLDPSLQTLKKLDQAGLLEAYILLGMPSEGIVDDYTPYFRAHRDLLERYVREVVLKGGSFGP